MNQLTTLNTRFAGLHACVLIPTYNNSATLAGVISDVAQYTDRLIVVNDGSTDHTAEILQHFSWLQVITIGQNRGKGFALRTGFSYARSKGYHYAITLDSDGQHFAKDLPRLLEGVAEQPGSIIIGARNMNQDTIPGKSSFGNRFSNFWFRAETGITLPDTQSGYRVYPLLPLEGIHFFSSRFEFEIEVLVRAAWKDIPILTLPVQVYYAPPGERVSHFRPVKDFARISLLNTLLVLVALFYIMPRNMFRTLLHQKKRQRWLNDHLLNAHHSDEKKALSIALGIFMGIIPVWGFQMLLAIFFAIVFKLNKGLVIIAANISIPPMIPLIVFLSYKVGAWFMPQSALQLAFSNRLTVQQVKTHFQQYLYGSMMLAVMSALLLGLLSYLLLKICKRKTLAAA